MLPLLKFVPIYKTMLWGGHRLPAYVGHPGPSQRVGEAWILSDVDGSLSTVADGPFAGRTLRSVATERAAELYGEHTPADGKFPLLLKFIDAKQELSVQVHPCDRLAVAHRGPGQRGKTEAWVVLDRNEQTSRIYAGFSAGQTEASFRAAVQANAVPATLHCYTPQVGDCVFLEAGTVHAIGADILLFEVQQTSDITYRLYDWNRVDAITGKPRELHIDLGLASSDFDGGPCEPIRKISTRRQELVACEYFTLTRHLLSEKEARTVGEPGHCRALVAVAGAGTVNDTPLHTGEVVLVPACCGAVTVRSESNLELLECCLG